MQAYRNEQGRLHRTDGPAFISADGLIQEWWVDGNIHRIDGPAVKHADGYQAWYINGKRHRTDGPAVICSNGDQEWWINNKQVDQLTHMLLVNQHNIQTQPQTVVL